MEPLPFTDLGARIAFDAVLVVFAAVELRVRVRSRLNRHGTRTDRASLLLVLLTVYLGVAGGFLIAANVDAAAITFGRWPLFVLGIALMIAGIAIRQWAVAMLGQYFTVQVRVHPGQTVVQRGPYRWAAHPSYTGMITSFVGIGLALGNWAALAWLAVLPTVGLVVRIRVEERALSDALGKPYRRFLATRARLIPGVW